MNRIFAVPQIVRFLLVGVLNTAMGFAVFAVAAFLTQGNIAISLASNIVVGIFFNFLTYGLGVFNSLGKVQFLKFVLAYLSLYFINYTALSFLRGHGLNIYLAQLINIVYLAPLSYLIFNRLVFVRRAGNVHVSRS
ncbi:GtrA-like protein [Polaromonas sp. YR568]|uniref:GtrA family protein n=1 Tax=Polaromonas sp. YR568 TaxID=1855301 RepID=UPI0008E05816|nr:GtrA family protein [Polaromonas sp. YR568]SFU91501.1 GtrA-like protein [Polaromonas sp. YR568]